MAASPMSGSGDRSSVYQPAQRSTEQAHYRANHGRDASLKRQPFEIVDVYEQSETVETAKAKAQNQILPVGSSAQIVEKQIDPEKHQGVIDAERRESDNHAGGHA